MADEYFSLTLAFSQPSQIDSFRGIPAYRLTCEVTASENMGTAVFVHRKTSTNNQVNPVVDVFQTVATPVDLVELSEVNPDVNGFILKSKVDILLTSIFHYAQAKAQLTKACTELCNQLAMLEDLEADTTAIIRAKIPVVTTTTSTTSTTTTTTTTTSTTSTTTAAP